MKTAGKTEEEITRAVSQMRREIGIKYKNETPPAKLNEISDRNIEKYKNDPLGPTIEKLRERGKSWAEIIESACRPGGEDLGL